MKGIINSVGIILSIIGTIMTLWTIFITKIEKVATWGDPDEIKENFLKEKKRVIIGSGLIIVGGLLQIICQFI